MSSRRGHLSCDCCIFSAQQMTRLTSVTSHHCQIFLLFQIKAVIASCLYTRSSLWQCRVPICGVTESVSGNPGDSLHLCASEGKMQVPRWQEGMGGSPQPASFHISTALICGDTESSQLLGEKCRRETGAPGQEISEKMKTPAISVIVFLEKQTNERLEPWKPAGAQPGEGKWGIW